MLCCLFEEMQSDSPAVHYFMGIFLSLFLPTICVTVFQFSIHNNLRARNLHSENEK